MVAVKNPLLKMHLSDEGILVDSLQLKTICYFLLVFKYLMLIIMSS